MQSTARSSTWIAMARVIALSVMALPNAHAAPTDPDPSFASGGSARFANVSHIRQGALFPDGGLALVLDRSAAPWNEIVRLDVAGLVDPRFSPIVPFVGNAGEPYAFNRIAITPAGQVIAAQTHDAHPICGFAVTRHRVDGALDESFGNRGALTFGGVRGCFLADTVLDAGQRIFVPRFSSAISVFSTSILRIPADGSRIEPFGTRQFVNVEPDVYGPLAFQPDGGLVALVGGSQGPSVARFIGDAPDASFGSAGVAYLNLAVFFGATALLALPDGKLVVAGVAMVDGANQFFVVRLNRDGTLDRAFGSHGIAVVRVARVRESVSSVTAALQADGRIVVAGSIGDQWPLQTWRGRIAVARLTADGAPDTRFAPGGVWEFQEQLNAALGFVVVRPDGRIVVGATVRKTAPGPTDGSEGVVFQLLGGDLAVAKPLRQRQVIEYFHADQGHYFVTSDPEEIALLDTASPPPWTRTGRTFEAWIENDGTLAPVCRFWSDQSFAPKSSHFYSPYADECAAVKAGTVWRFERDPFLLRMPEGPQGARSCPAQTNPLYRAYNNGRGGAPNHRYTTDAALLDAMIAEGWTFEGEAQTRVFACVPAP